MLSKKELEDARADVYSSLNDKVEEYTGKRVTQRELKDIFEHTLKEAFNKAAETGYLRLPGGLGVIKVVQRNSLVVNTPGGDVLDVPRRKKIKFECGTYQGRLAESLSETIEE